MKVIIVGGTGLIGGAVAKELGPRHDLIVVGHEQGEIRVDIGDPESIKAMYSAIGAFDALIAVTGRVVFKDLDELTEKDYQISINNKLMGQVNLVSLGLPHISDKGSFTLTSGILNCDPIRTGVAAALVNGGLEGFTKAAAQELPRNVRVNLISPTVVLEAMETYGEYFPGFQGVPVAQVALAYRKSVEGAQTGQVYRVGYSL